MRMIKTTTVILLLIFVTVADASIKWRRITKTTAAPIHSSTTETTPSATKSPVTWRRSTLSRRSTPERELPEIIEEEEHEEEDIDVADSKEDISIVEEDGEEESAIKPLVPGSRPGFWFDSSRKRKPSALLRPGSRKSSLFPNKLSTPATPNTTFESSTLAPVFPVTTPRSIHSSKLNQTSSNRSKTFGRTSSTKPPVAFKRRLKTTKSPRKPSTTAAPETEQLENDEELPSETEEDFNAKEKDLIPPSDSNKPKEKTTSLPYESIRLPGIRRRKNGTRTPWRKEGSRYSPTSKPLSKISKTTSIPEIKSSRTTPTTTAHGYTRPTKKSTRVKSRTKSNRTTALPQRTRTKSTPATTVSSTSSSTSSDKKTAHAIKGPTNFLRNRNVHQFNRLKPKPVPEEIEEDDIDLISTTPGPSDDDVVVVNTARELDVHVKSTVEPFYITRDYGELVTAVPEIARKKERVAVRSTTATPVTKGTKETEKLQNVEVNETKNDISSEENGNFDISGIDDSFKYPDSISRHSVQHNRETTFKPSPTIPTISHTVDPGTNAYVVWSLGQGGSGWSYEKQGGQVKWSAQNSPAEGDRWSVQGNEDEGKVWDSINRTSSDSGIKRGEPIASDADKDKKIYYPNAEGGFDNTNYWRPVTYMPNIPYKNETILKFTTPGIDKISDIKGFSPYPPGIRDFSPIVFQNTDNSALPDNLQHPARHTDIPNYQNSKKENYSIHNQTSSLNYPYASNDNLEPPNDHSNTYEPINVSNVQEYQTPKAENYWNLPTTISTPLESPGLFKSPNPYVYAEDVTVPDAGFAEEFPVTMDTPAYFNGGQQRDLSGIPPELAKAVVDAKRWTVVGTGGAEGWSLLGEDGQLEWKIHNIDGRWSVTSGDKLLKLPLKVPSPSAGDPYDGDNTKRNVEVENENEKSTSSSPKIWKLEDDYNKWKVLSAEGGIQVDSKENRWKSNREYDYDQNAGLENDYYLDEDDYEGTEDNIFTPPSFSENVDDRPFWRTGENQMNRKYPIDNEGHLSPNVRGFESANTKEDAIEAWKTLIVEEGNWKISKENFDENPRKSFNSKYSRNSPSRVSSEWKSPSKMTTKPQINLEERAFEDFTVSSSKNNKVPEDRELQYGAYYNENPTLKENDSDHVKGFVDNTEKEAKSKEDKNSINYLKDHAKIDTLINKLENIKKESKGRAVVDLSQLLKLIKSNRNSSSEKQILKKNAEERNQTDDITSRDKTVTYQNFRHQENSEKYTPQKKDSIHPSDDQHIQRAMYEKYLKELKKKDVEHFHNTKRRENEQLLRDQNYQLRKFNEDRINYKKQDIPNNHKFKISEEYEDSGLNFKNEKERYHIKEVEPTENVQNSNRYSTVNNRPPQSNREKYSTDKNTKENNDKQKFVSHIDVSSEEGKNRRKMPPNHGKQAGNDASQRAYDADQGTEIYYPFFNERHEPDNKPKRTQDGFQTSSPLNDDPDQSNRDSREKYISSKNRRKRPHTRKRYRSRPGHIKTSDNSQKLHDSSADTTFANERKHRIEHSKYEHSRRPGLYEEKKLPEKLEENRYPEVYEENRRPERYDDSRYSGRYKERRPERNEDNRRPDMSKGRRRPEKNVYDSSPEVLTMRQRPDMSTERRRPEETVDYSSPEVLKMRQSPDMSTERRRPEEIVYDSSPEVLTMRQRPDMSTERRRPEEIVYDSSPEVLTMRQRQKAKLINNNQQSPVVISSETEIEDDEDGSKKNRKIIVIDYAGRQKKKSPIDRKDLELIIRSVKNRRAEVTEEDHSENHQIQ